MVGVKSYPSKHTKESVFKNIVQTVMLDMFEDFIEDLRESIKMGDNPARIEMSSIEKYNESTWTYLKEDGLVPFMQCIKEYDEFVSM